MILNLMSAAIPAVVCGFLCAASQGNPDCFSDDFQTARAPRELEDYALAPLDMPLDQAVKLEDYSTRHETAIVYKDILDYVEKRTQLEASIKEHASIPVGFALSVFGFLLAVFFKANIIALIICFAVSHIFFFKWFRSRRSKRISPVDWECKKFRGQYYADSVYPCVFQARIHARVYYEVVKEIAATNKTGKQFYLFTALIVGVIVVFPNFF